MKIYKEKDGKIWKAKGYPLDLSGTVDELEELVKETEWLRHRIKELEAYIEQMADSPLTWEGQNKIACEKAQELRDAQKRISELEMALANAEDDFTAAKARIAELEHAQTTPSVMTPTQEHMARVNATIKNAPWFEKQPAPAVTPEWLAERWQNAMASKVNWISGWSSISERGRQDQIAIATRVLEHMPAPAAPAVDVKQLIKDYHLDRAGHGLQQHVFYKGCLKYALEAQGVKCK